MCFFSDSSDACSPKFKILGESYVAYFFILPQTAPQILCIAGHDFLLPLVGGTSSPICSSSRGQADRGCLRPFGEVRLRRDNGLW